MRSYYFSIPVQEETDKNIIFTADTDTESFIIQGSWEDDMSSDSNGHWIFVIDRVTGEDSTEERSVVLNPGSVYFQYDDIYTLTVYSDNDSIGFDSLQDVTLIFSIRGEDE